MKIEIAESLTYSWLRHIKGCHITQNNWKTSPCWNFSKKVDADAVMNAVNSHTFIGGPKIAIKGIFSSSIDQTIKQAECDAIGINLIANEIYAVDVAFHSNGLGYGDTKTNIKRVLEKCARTAMCIIGFTGRTEADIYFASPKIRSSVLGPLQLCIGQLESIIIGLGYNFRFHLITNDDFRDEILLPIIKIANNVGDSNELFIRSITLLQMYGSCSASTIISTPVSTTIHTSNGCSTPFIPIGQFAKQTFTDLLNNGKLTSQQINDLQDGAFCKTTFGMNYPILIDANCITASLKPRYYKDLVGIYHISNDWYERNRTRLEDWLKTI